MRKLTVLLCLLASLSVQAKPLSVKECGAVGDGVTLDTKAIQAAIDSVAAQGGGVVEVPSGVYLTGSIWLRDNINLYLNPGAVIKGSPDLKDYCDENCCSQNEAEIKGGDYISGGHLIMGVGVINVCITGQ